MKFVISSKRIIRVMILAALVLTLTGLAAEIVWSFRGPRKGTVLEILTPLDLAADSAIPTWYSSLALLFCSVLLAMIAAAKKRRGQGYTLHWSVLSGIFLLLSIDEVAAIHETVGVVSSYLAISMGFTPSGLIYSSLDEIFWVVPGAVFVLVVLLAYVRFLFHLPKSTLLLFLVAGGLFVAGAIGVEMFTSLQVELFTSLLASDAGMIEKNTTKNGLDNLQMIPYPVLIATEEGLEMLGIIVFAYALLSYISLYAREITLLIRTHDEIQSEEETYTAE